MNSRQVLRFFLIGLTAAAGLLTMACGGSSSGSSGDIGVSPEHKQPASASHQSGGDYWDLLTAIDHGDADGVRKLVESGADPNAAPDGNPILSEAIWRGEVEILEILLEAGADPNVPLDYGSHLYDAIRLEDTNSRVRLKTVRTRVDAGADVNWS